MAENKWVIGVITPINGVTTLLITGRGQPCIYLFPILVSDGNEGMKLLLVMMGIKIPSFRSLAAPASIMEKKHVFFFKTIWVFPKIGVNQTPPNP